jgi:hypothetical protein
MPEDLKVLQKAYDLCVYLVPMVNRFPRDFKFTLGDRVANACFDLVEALVDARYTRERREILTRANLRLERMRVMLRLSKDLGVFPLKSLEHSSRLIDEVGAMVGGWLKRT